MLYSNAQLSFKTVSYCTGRTDWPRHEAISPANGIIIAAGCFEQFPEKRSKAGQLLSDGRETALERARGVREVIHVRRRHS